MAGKSVTMFIVNVSKSMGATRSVVLPPGSNNEERSVEMSQLQCALQYVKSKIFSMIYDGRKTEQCGIIIFGTEGTENSIHDRQGGYENVTEFIPIAHPSTATLRELGKLRPSAYTAGDAVDAIIVGMDLQNNFLSRKKTWTRKVILVTNGYTQIDRQGWESTVEMMNQWNVGLTVVGVDFDDEDLGFMDNNKSIRKRENEEFLHDFCLNLNDYVIGNIDHALQSVSFPQVRSTNLSSTGSILRIGDVNKKMEEAMEIFIRTSKCTAIATPKSFAKFAVRPKTVAEEEAERQKKMEVDGKNVKSRVIYAQLSKPRPEYFVDKSEPKSNEDEMDIEDHTEARLDKVQKDRLIKGFKYGTSYALCQEGTFARLPTKKGIDLLGFIRAEEFHREYSMGEIHYVWSDSALSQCALSSIVQAMNENNLLALGRWVTADGRDAKMGVMCPALFEKVHCLLWAQVPFADDVRRYVFPSLSNLREKGGTVAEHRYLPTAEQLAKMDEFVDSMNLMKAGYKDNDGNRTEWFTIQDSYNPSLHRLKQAMLHSVSMKDLETNPVPPPHPELLKYFNPPKRMIKEAQKIIEESIQVFDIKRVSKKTRVLRKAHEHAEDEDEPILLLDRTSSACKLQSGPSQLPPQTPWAGTNDNPQRLPTPVGANNDAMDVDE